MISHMMCLAGAPSMVQEWVTCGTVVSGSIIQSSICVCQHQWVAVNAGAESWLHSMTAATCASDLQAAVKRCAYRASDKSSAPTMGHLPCLMAPVITPDLWVQPVVRKGGWVGGRGGPPQAEPQDRCRASQLIPARPVLSFDDQNWLNREDA